jgi:hypothetical protein
MTSQNVRIVLLNAFPLNAFDYRTFTALFTRVTVDQLVSEIKQNYEVINYIRHEGTVKTLSKLLGIELKPSADIYKFSKNNIIYVVTLKKVERGKEVTEVKVEDLDIVRVVVVEGAWI